MRRGEVFFQVEDCVKGRREQEEEVQERRGEMEGKEGVKKGTGRRTCSINIFECVARGRGGEREREQQQGKGSKEASKQSKDRTNWNSSASPTLISHPSLCLSSLCPSLSLSLSLYLVLVFTNTGTKEEQKNNQPCQACNQDKKKPAIHSMPFRNNFPAL